VPPSRENVRKIGEGLVGSYRRGDAVGALPMAVGIDVSDACNIACTVCSREIAWDKRRHPFLKFDQFVRIFDQIRPVYLSFSGYGETLLNKELPAMIGYATEAGTRVNIVSNGTLLDDKKARALLESGLARLKISLDGAEPEVYARHRAGADLEVVLHNIERFCAMRDALRHMHPQVEVQMVIFNENVDQVAKLIELAHKRLPGVEPVYLMMLAYGEQEGFVGKQLPHGDPAATTELRRARDLAVRYGFQRTRSTLDTAIAQLTQEQSGSPCYVPWFSCMISTDGELYPCHHHTVNGKSLGNVFQRPFAEVWDGPGMQAFRARLRERRCDDRVCATCMSEDVAMDRVFSAVSRLPGLAAMRA
jgi:radical SAM protein with 4Fe4S-binding SPASM domain